MNPEKLKPGIGSYISRGLGSGRGGLVLPVVLALVLSRLAGPAQAQSNSERAAAAASTASNNASCKILTSFYWEIGDRDAKLAYGTRGIFPPGAKDPLPIYSASKWLFGAYVYERRGGQLSTAEIRYLNLTSGNTGSAQCTLNNTVSACRGLMGPGNPGRAGSFYYAPAHFQQQAMEMGLGNQTKAQLATTLRGVLGNDLSLSYPRPHMAGGVQMSAAQYGLFLRKILSGRLLLSGGALGSHAVCTYTSETSATTGRVQCPNALFSPTDGIDHSLEEAWSYSLGHWVENDPVVGDGAFSSPGFGGFYPWIDSSRSYYGVLARLETKASSAGASVSCGRLIRKAWLTGIVQP